MYDFSSNNIFNICPYFMWKKLNFIENIDFLIVLTLL